MKNFIFEFKRPGMIFTYVRSFAATDFETAQSLAERHAKIQGWDLVSYMGKF